MPGTDHGQRRDAEQREEAQGRSRILFAAPRTACDVQLAGGVVRAHPAGAGVARRQIVDPAVQRRPPAGRAAPVVGLFDDRLPLRPDSRGEIKLRSADPSASPAVHPNYLTAATDQQTIVAGLRLCRELLAQTALAQFVASEYLPGSAVQSDAELLDFARRRGGTVYHPTSTCKMGIDAMAVVDPELRVRGVTGLRVADASIMPTVISGNTNAATIMIGERCADLVRQEMRIAA